MFDIGVLVYYECEPDLVYFVLWFFKTDFYVILTLLLKW